MGSFSAETSGALREFQQQPLGRLLGVLADLPGPRRYLVGGPVRDLLLRRPVTDLDLAVDGDAESLVQRAAEALRGAVTEHQRFATWRLDLATGERLDFAALRRESYPAPGHLPAVRPGDLESDLRRRDFTVNAMAIELAESLSGPLHDPHGGREDLRSRHLRVLHQGSFSDDPTRLWRSARFAARLGFKLEPESARWAGQAVAGRALETLSGPRLAREIEYLFEDEGGLRPAAYAAAARALGLWRALDPRLATSPPADEELERGAHRWRQRSGTAPPWTVAFGAILDALESAEASALVERLGLSRATAGELLARPSADLAKRLTAAGERYGVLLTAELGNLPTAVRARLWARNGGLRRWIEIFEGAPSPKVTGATLIAAGARPGPALGEALTRTHGALVDGTIGPAEELAYALRIWQSLS
ncbi:MAG: hypothetical protein AAF481_14840 [Acidobacteriota bacterium]